MPFAPGTNKRAR